MQILDKAILETRVIRARQREHPWDDEVSTSYTNYSVYRCRATI